MAAPKQDVNDMFERMGQKLGWFKHKDLDGALKALSEPPKKKPSKLRLKKSSKKTGSTSSDIPAESEPSEMKENKPPNNHTSHKKQARPKPDRSKALSFKGILSSDSDSSDFEDDKGGNSKPTTKGGKPQVILQVASDSDEDGSVYREDTYVSCIGESPDKTNRLSLAPPSYDSLNGQRGSNGSYEYEETVLKGRVSVATFSFDMDSIGEPLVESTRIHRRSSVSYKQIISPDTSEGSLRDGVSLETSPCLQKYEARDDIAKDTSNNDLICSGLGNLTLQKDQIQAKNREIDESCEDIVGSSVMHMNDTRYTTAIEHEGDLDATNVFHEIQVNDNKRDTKKDKQQIIKAGSLDMITETSSSSESELEIIEVVDAETQTDMEALEECDTQLVNPVYCEDTVYDAPAYHQTTVCKESIEDTQATDVMLELEEYDQSTVNTEEDQVHKLCLEDNQSIETVPDTSCNYNNTTNTKCSGSLYEQKTVNIEPAVKKTNANTEMVTSEASRNSSLESTASDYSVIEVQDMAIQTDSLHDISDELDGKETLDEAARHGTSEDTCDEQDSEDVSAELVEAVDKSLDLSTASTSAADKSKGVSDKSLDISETSIAVSDESKDKSDESMDVSDESKDVTDESKDVSMASSSAADKSVDVSEKSIYVSDKATNVSMESLSAADKCSDKSSDLSDAATGTADNPVDMDDGNKSESDASLVDNNPETSVISNDGSNNSGSVGSNVSEKEKKSSGNFSMLSSDSDDDDHHDEDNNDGGVDNTETSKGNQSDVDESLVDNNPETSVFSNEGSNNSGSVGSNVSGKEKKSSANFSMLSSDDDDDDDVDDDNDVGGDDVDDDKNKSGDDSDDDFDNDELDFSTIRQRAERNAARKPRHDSRDTREPQELDTTNQSWRERKCSSDSSDDEDKLEAFFQKLRKPEKEKSESEQSEDEQSLPSLDEFIVEDDDMTSESDEEAFHIRETLKLEEKSLKERLKKKKGALVKPTPNQFSDDSDEDDEVFSSKLYPDSVTKHKKQNIAKPKGTPRSWSLSSDSEGTGSDNSPQHKQGTGTHNNNNRKTSKPGTLKQPKGNVTKKMNFSDVSSDSDSEEFPLFKTPNPIRKTKKIVQSTGKENKPRSLKVGGRETGSVSEDKQKKGKTPRKKVLGSYISLSDDDSDENDDSYPSIGSISSSTDNTSSTNVSGQDENLFKLPTPVSVRAKPSRVVTPVSTRVVTPLASRGSLTYSFLRSLSSFVEDENWRHPDAVRFVKNFKKTKEELTQHLFSMYNRTIFEGKLPTDLSILWNKRLLRTAGYCAYKRHRGNQEDRTARVELSTKVCDSAERVRDTLVHELCHAAVWLLNGVNGGHGPFWKYWARQSNKMHPELPAIGRCHSYAINTKFTYKCTKCGYSIGRHSKSLNTEKKVCGYCHGTFELLNKIINIGRHSKSLNTEKKVCGYCHGTFELLTNSTQATPRSAAGSAQGSLSSAPATPRTPNRFALFVKDHYSVVKQKDKTMKHGDVMKQLSKLFAESKITT